MALPPPPYPSASGLLTNKTVVVTAAAGTGIGYATAKRCIEEGATVLISDIHERRLGEAATRIGDETGTAPLTAVCNVTDEAQVQGLVTKLGGQGVDDVGRVVGGAVVHHQERERRADPGERSV